MIRKKNNRKATAIIVAALLCISGTYAQHDSENYTRHRLYLNYGMGYANTIFDKIDPSFINADYSLSSSLELRYAFFFAPKWGISLGAGVSDFSAKATLNMEGVIPHYNDPSFDPSGHQYYDLYYKTENLKEKQQIRALEIPLQFHFENRPANGKIGLFAGLGAKAYLPIITAQSVFSQADGTLTVTGYESFTDTWFTDAPHFGRQDVRTTPATVKLNYSVDAIADFGGLFRLSDACDLYAGIHAGYGLMDILPKQADKKDVITPERSNLFVINSLLATNMLAEYNKSNLQKVDEKWNRWQAGIKIGIHFKIR